MYARVDIDIFVAYLIYPYGGARHARHEAYREAWSLIGPSKLRPLHSSLAACKTAAPGPDISIPAS
jgi:hypothetical protein